MTYQIEVFYDGELRTISFSRKNYSLFSEICDLLDHYDIEYESKEADDDG